MIDLILINSPDEFYTSQFKSDPKMPLGLLYIESFIKTKGYSTKIIDCHTNDYSKNDILQQLIQHNPKLIGINSTTPNRKVIFDLIESIKKVLPKTIVIAGGPHATSMPEDFFKHAPSINGVVIGEGEETTLKILQNLDCYENIEGFYTALNYSSTKTKTYSQRLTHLDLLPFPNFEAVEIEKYLSISNSLYITCTRGCRYDCAFCSVRTLLGKSVQYRSAENVIDEMKALHKKFGVNKFNFYDDDIVMWPELENFCEKNKNLELFWTAQATINDIKIEHIQLLSDGGCISLSFGFESGSYKMQKFIAKIIKERSINMLPLLKKSGIITRGYFVIGFPLETIEDIAETILYIIKLKTLGLNDIAVFSARPYPGTRLFDQCLQLYGEDKKDEILNFYYIKDFESHEDLYVKAKMRRYNTLPSFQVNNQFKSEEVRKFVALAFYTFQHHNKFLNYSKEDIIELLYKELQNEIYTTLA